ncbi:hypothetical protein SAMN04488102_10691 [Alkalibacterium subtropicum]|uniref:Type IV pilus assembly protein PilN n=1 Tax=Alkalibacterium subtropicum TaxID=753702 RepID=A0A1I1IZA5_9LACT|nr:hypothetical protein [Alkalibacterium subtropicum]SFC41495.1 hypothetical protein SAMN04488102_10691 [Alkalibacterium subtropicum]
MIEVNFFEKKAINVLPYILAGIFFIFLGLIGTYFYYTHAAYSNLEQDNSQWIQVNAEEVGLSREIESLDELASQAAQVQENLDQARFPMVYVTEDLSAAVSNEGQQVASFQLNDADQAILLLENTEVTEAAAIIDDLEARSYVDRVQFLRLESQQAESDQFLFELTVDLDVEALREEARSQ